MKGIVLLKEIEHNVTRDKFKLKYYNCRKNGNFIGERTERKRVYPHSSSLITYVRSQELVAHIFMNSLWIQQQKTHATHDKGGFVKYLRILAKTQSLQWNQFYEGCD